VQPYFHSDIWRTDCPRVVGNSRSINPDCGITGGTAAFAGAGVNLFFGRLNQVASSIVVDNAAQDFRTSSSSFFLLLAACIAMLRERIFSSFHYDNSISIHYNSAADIHVGCGIASGGFQLRLSRFDISISTSSSISSLRFSVFASGSTRKRRAYLTILRSVSQVGSRPSDVVV